MKFPICETQRQRDLRVRFNVFSVELRSPGDAQRHLYLSSLLAFVPSPRPGAAYSSFVCLSVRAHLPLRCAPPEATGDSAASGQKEAGKVFGMGRG